MTPDAPDWQPAEADDLAAAWNEGFEAASDWIGNNPPPSGIWSDPPTNPYMTPRPIRSSSKKGERDGKQGGVHPGRAGQVADRSGGAGVHGGPSVLDRSGSDPQERLTDRTGRGLTQVAPDDAFPSSGAAEADEMRDVAVTT